MKRSRNKHTASAAPAQTPESMAALAGRMADDFNNILTTVMGACSLIDKDVPANGELLQCVALIRASAEHAADLSDRLMHVGTLGHDTTPLGAQPQNSCSADTSERDKKAVDDIVPSNNHTGGALS